jgi:hypothetical protein
MRSSLMLVAVAGCSYTPGAFYAQSVGTFFGTKATVGCLDLGIERRGDVEGSPTLEYSFGNRCDRTVTLDFSHIAVIGRTASGEEMALRPFDPSLELRPLGLDARFAGQETLAYLTTSPIVQICVDAATIAIDDGKKESRWMCFASKGPPAEPARDTIADDDPYGDDKTSVDGGEAAAALEHEERSL